MRLFTSRIPHIGGLICEMNSISIVMRGIKKKILSFLRSRFGLAMSEFWEHLVAQPIQAKSFDRNILRRDSENFFFKRFVTICKHPTANREWNWSDNILVGFCHAIANEWGGVFFFLFFLFFSFFFSLSHSDDLHRIYSTFWFFLLKMVKFSSETTE